MRMVDSTDVGNNPEKSYQEDGSFSGSNISDLLKNYKTLKEFQNAEALCIHFIRKRLVTNFNSSSCDTGQDFDIVSKKEDLTIIRNHPTYLSLLKNNSLEEAQKTIANTPLDASLSGNEMEQLDRYYKHYFEDVIANPGTMDYKTKEIITDSDIIAKIPPHDKFNYKKVTLTQNDSQTPDIKTVFALFQKVMFNQDVSKNTIRLGDYTIAKLHSRVIRTICIGGNHPAYFALMLDDQKIGAEILGSLRVKYIDLMGKQRPEQSTPQYTIDLSIKHVAYITKLFTIPLVLAID